MIVQGNILSWEVTAVQPSHEHVDSSESMDARQDKNINVQLSCKHADWLAGRTKRAPTSSTNKCTRTATLTRPAGRRITSTRASKCSRSSKWRGEQAGPCRAVLGINILRGENYRNIAKGEKTP